MMLLHNYAFFYSSIVILFCKFQKFFIFVKLFSNFFLKNFITKYTLLKIEFVKNLNVQKNIIIYKF